MPGIVGLKELCKPYLFGHNVTLSVVLTAKWKNKEVVNLGNISNGRDGTRGKYICKDDNHCRNIQVLFANLGRIEGYSSILLYAIINSKNVLLTCFNTYMSPTK